MLPTLRYHFVTDPKDDPNFRLAERRLYIIPTGLSIMLSYVFPEGPGARRVEKLKFLSPCRSSVLRSRHCRCNFVTLFELAVFSLLRRQGSPNTVVELERFEMFLSGRRRVPKIRYDQRE